MVNTSFPVLGCGFRATGLRVSGLWKVNRKEMIEESFLGKGGWMDGLVVWWFGGFGLEDGYVGR